METNESFEIKEPRINRRTALKLGAILGGTLAFNGLTLNTAEALDISRPEVTGKMHILGANDMTTTEGYWTNTTAPALAMKSGEVVSIETNTHLKGKMVPGVGIQEWMDYYKEVIDKTPETYTRPFGKTGAKKIKKGGGHHTLTGPIAVEGAEVGDVLQIEILDIVPGPYGFNLNPETDFMKLGLLAEDYPKGRVKWYYADPKKKKFEFLPGVEIPLRPFPGTIGVGIPDEGMWSNVPPGNHGGNLDNKELVEGSVLYLPVLIKGGMLKVGDAHLAQGDGEVNLNALEGAFKNITLRLTVRKDLSSVVNWPFASTPTHWITMGIHTDLLESSKMAVRNAIAFLGKQYGMSELDAYAFCSMAVDLHVTQLVDYTLGIHAMIPKAVFVGDQYKGKSDLLL
jgi:acetamidase/formamidase